jgi:hypothetical protein
MSDASMTIGDRGPDMVASAAGADMEESRASLAEMPIQVTAVDPERNPHNPPRRCRVDGAGPTGTMMVTGRAKSKAMKDEHLPHHCVCRLEPARPFDGCSSPLDHRQDMGETGFAMGLRGELTLRIIPEQRDSQGEIIGLVEGRCFERAGFVVREFAAMQSQRYCRVFLPAQ